LISIPTYPSKTATKNLVPLLEEKQSSAQLPGFIEFGAKGQPVSSNLKTTLGYKGGEIHHPAGAEIIIKGGVEGGESAA